MIAPTTLSCDPPLPEGEEARIRLARASYCAKASRRRLRAALRALLSDAVEEEEEEALLRLRTSS